MRRTEEEKLCCGLIETHHYLRYTQPVGEHLTRRSRNQTGELAFRLQASGFSQGLNEAVEHPLDLTDESIELTMGLSG